MRSWKRRPLVAAFVLSVAAAAFVAFGVGGAASAASAKSSAKACKGAPIKIMESTNLSNPTGGGVNPEHAAGAKAAAAALTKSCQLGRPVKVIVCDDKFDPNATAACGRQAVSEGVVAFTYYGGFGDSYMPIIAAAGIPSVGNNATSSAENTSPLSFPGVFAVPAFIGNITLAASLGAKSIVLPVIDIPSVVFAVDIAKKTAAAYGMKATVVPVPPTATDMSAIAGQILSAKPDAIITITGGPQVEALIKSLAQQGADFKKTRFIQDFVVLSPALAKRVGGKLMNGIYSTGQTWSPTDTSNPGIKRYLAELKAAGQPSGATQVSSLGILGWASVHLVADALTGQKQLTAATVVKRLNTKGAIDTTKYALPPIDYTKPAIPKDKVLSTLRIFNHYTSNWRFDNKGIPHPITKGWTDIFHKVKVTGA